MAQPWNANFQICLHWIRKHHWPYKVGMVWPMDTFNTRHPFSAKVLPAPEKHTHTWGRLLSFHIFAISSLNSNDVVARVHHSGIHSFNWLESTYLSPCFPKGEGFKIDKFSSGTDSFTWYGGCNFYLGICTVGVIFCTFGVTFYLLNWMSGARGRPRRSCTTTNGAPQRSIP